MRTRAPGIRVFAKLCGCVRFFHLSYEAAAMDWDAFAAHGVRQVEAAGDVVELRRELLALFRPMAPTTELAEESPSAEPIEEREGLSVVAWQHYGARLSGRSNIYRSDRVNRDPLTEPLCTVTRNFIRRSLYH